MTVLHLHLPMKIPCVRVLQLLAILAGTIFPRRNVPVLARLAVIVPLVAAALAIATVAPAPVHAVLLVHPPRATPITFGTRSRSRRKCAGMV